MTARALFDPQVYRTLVVLGVLLAALLAVAVGVWIFRVGYEQGVRDARAARSGAGVYRWFTSPAGGEETGRVR